MRRDKRRMPLLACALGLAAAVGVTGCSAASVSGADPAPAVSPSGPATAAAVAWSATSPYVVTAGGPTLRWPDVTATLMPASLPGVVPAARAYASIRAGFDNSAREEALSGTPTAELALYSTPVSGAARTPVWLFRMPVVLSDPSLSQGGIGSTPPPARSGCEFYWIVGAAHGDFLTSGQHCPGP